MNTATMERPATVQVSLGRKVGYLRSEDTDRINRLVERVCPPVEKVANPELRMGYEIRNGLTGQRISEVSKQYTLIDNKRLLMPFLNHFGIGSMRELRTYGGGKYLYVSFDTGRQFDMGRGDFIKERLIIKNSYDKTRAFSFMLGAYRMVCSNGLYAFDSVGLDCNKIHVGDIPVEQLIDGVLNRYSENTFQLWRNFADTPMSLEEQLALSAGFKAYLEEEKAGTLKSVLTNEAVNKQVNERTNYYLNFPESVDNQRTAWGLYNQMNRAITKVVNGNSEINKRMLGNKNAERYIHERTSGSVSPNTNTD